MSSTARTPSASDTARGVRVGTLIWGVAALLVAGGALSTVVLDVAIDPVLALIVLCGFVGVALITGGLVSATRGR